MPAETVAAHISANAGAPVFSVFNDVTDCNALDYIGYVWERNKFHYLLEANSWSRERFSGKLLGQFWKSR
jgi:hypothetical protein